ncbi:MAG: carboxypeptidase regulatory-like domain-containing protein [Planctomycetes bacterium]|nr:carboxypeptidase regulatory-like domain-containing protein [Planctomycetota bacterium]
MRSAQIAASCACALLGVAGAVGAAEPAWVAGWREAPVPVGSVEAEQRAAYFRRAELPPSWAEGRTRTLRFELTAAESGAPVSGALVSSWQYRQHGFTGPSGELGPTPWYVGASGVVFVTVSAPGRATSQGWLHPVGDVVRLALAPETRHRVRARVLDPSGKPAAGCAWALTLREATAAAPSGEGPPLLPPAADPLSGRSDAAGWVELRLGGEGRLRLSLPNVGCAELPAPASATAEWKVALEPRGGQLVAGQVCDPAGKPLAGAKLQDARSAATVVADREGRFRLTHCLEGLYCFVVAGPGGEEADDVTAFTYPGQPRDAVQVIAR